MEDEIDGAIPSEYWENLKAEIFQFVYQSYNTASDSVFGS